MSMLCVFDVNETLLDLAPLDGVFEELTGSLSARREWFDLVVHTALTLASTGTYRDFGEIAVACASEVAARHGRQVSEAECRAVAAAMRALPAHPDVASALRRLRAAHFELVALTNSPLASARAQLSHSGLEPLLEALATLEAAEVDQAPPVWLLDELPLLDADLLSAPDDKLRVIFEAFRLVVRYDKRHHNATVQVTIAGDTAEHLDANVVRVAPSCDNEQRPVHTALAGSHLRRTPNRIRTGAAALKERIGHLF